MLSIRGDIVTREFPSRELDGLVDDLVAELEFHNYRVTRINSIDNVLEQIERGLSTSMTFRYYKIVEFCNLNSCAELISSDLLAGVFMPVRFIVYQRRETPSAYVSYLKPTAFARLFESASLQQVAAILEKDMRDVMAELAG